MRFILKIARVVVLMGLGCCIQQAEAAKRRPNGCDWIGGNFSDPADIIFNTGCRRGGSRQRVAAPVQKSRDAPPKLLDRLGAKAPAQYGASTRKTVGSGIERFQIVGGTVAYGLDLDARLWRFTLGTKDAAIVGHTVVQFRATDAALYSLEKDGTLWRSEVDGSKPVFLDHEVRDFHPVGDLVYVAGTDKRLWRLHGTGARDLVDENVAQFHATDAKLVFVLGTDGALWRETGDVHNRTKLAQPAAGFDYSTSRDTMFVLTPNHILWRQKNTEIAQQVDHDVAAFHVVEAGLVYVLATDGRLWQERGDRSQAALVDGDLAVKLGDDAFQTTGAGGLDSIYLLDRRHELWVETMPTLAAAMNK